MLHYCMHFGYKELEASFSLAYIYVCVCVCVCLCACVCVSAPPRKLCQHLLVVVSGQQCKLLANAFWNVWSSSILQGGLLASSLQLEVKCLFFARV